MATSLTGSPSKAYADLDLTSATSPLAAVVGLKLFMFEGTSCEEHPCHTRRKGDSTAFGNYSNKGNVSGENTEHNTSHWEEILDDGQVIETGLQQKAGAGTIAVCETDVTDWRE